jgi:hypothetical protein
MGIVTILAVLVIVGCGAAGWQQLVARGAAAEVEMRWDDEMRREQVMSSPAEVELREGSARCPELAHQVP